MNKDFLWGVSTSAGQIEGAVSQDGRTPSIWDTFSKIPGKIVNDHTPDIACDSYNRFDRDLESLKFLGVNTYRFSISWSRVLPDGTGKLNPKGVDYYKRMVEKLNNAGIIPNVTLYHWDLPQVLEDRGGWPNRDSIEWFGEYASKMFSELGDAVPMWSTINEPIATYIGYAKGGFAPGHTDEKLGNQARHNILVAHGKAVEAFRAAGLKDSKIGVVIDIWKRHPAHDTPEDWAIVRDEDETNWKFYCDPILAGHYSDYIIDKFTREGTLMDMKPCDFELTSQKLDYFGLNVYNRIVVSADSRAEADFKRGGNFLDNGVEYYPEALYDAVKLLKDLYNINVPIYVTENGTYHWGPEADGESGMIEDEYRIKYLSGFLTQLERAIKDGYDIRGYYAWSLMDNFEWAGGYNGRFGLNKLENGTMNLIPKKSAYFYKDYIKSKRN